MSCYYIINSRTVKNILLLHTSYFMLHAACCMLRAAFLTDDRPVVPGSVTVAVLHEYTLRYSTNYVQELRGFGCSIIVYILQYQILAPLRVERCDVVMMWCCDVVMLWYCDVLWFVIRGTSAVQRAQRSWRKRALFVLCNLHNLLIVYWIQKCSERAKTNALGVSTLIRYAFYWYSIGNFRYLKYKVIRAPVIYTTPLELINCSSRPMSYVITRESYTTIRRSGTWVHDDIFPTSIDVYHFSVNRWRATYQIRMVTMFFGICRRFWQRSLNWGRQSHFWKHTYVLGQLYLSSRKRGLVNRYPGTFILQVFQMCNLE